MAQIKFSNIYNKMLNNPFEEMPKTAMLLEVFIKDIKDLHPGFIEYDTIYFNQQTNKDEHYQITGEKVIILLLKSEFVNGEVMIWTTVRRYTPEKYDYYSKSRSQEFDIVIVE